MTRPTPESVDATVAYYDGIAETYDALLETTPGDRWIRGAFRAWVRAVVPPGGTVFDVGCGTGADARWYAGQGLTVHVYDRSPGMMARTMARTGEDILHRRVIPARDGLAAHPEGTVDAVTANFAVLNHLPRVDAFFREAARALRPDGSVMVSVHNPWFWKDIVRRQAWRPGWWSEVLAAPLRGTVRLPIAFGTLHQHTTTAMRRAARPALDLADRAGVGWLVRHGRGDPDWENPSTLAQRVERRLWRTPGFRSLGRYAFLRFAKRHA